MQTRFDFASIHRLAIWTFAFNPWLDGKCIGFLNGKRLFPKSILCKRLAKGGHYPPLIIWWAWVAD